MSLTVKLDAERYWALRDFCASGRDKVVEPSEIERRYQELLELLAAGRLI